MTDLLHVSKRDRASGEKAKDVRKQGFVPAILFGPAMEPQSIKVPANKIAPIIQSGEQMVEIQVDQGEKHLANIQEVQTDPIKGQMLHVAFYAARQDVKSKFSVPLRMEGSAPGEKDGGIVGLDMHEIHIHCLPKDVPNEIVVNVSELNVGDHIESKDLKLATGIEIDEHELERTVVSCHVPSRSATSLETEAATEPEVTGQGEEEKPEGDTAAPAAEEKKAS